MALPTQSVLSAKIQSFVKNNQETDSDKAIKEFGDGLAKIILDSLRAATVVMPPGSIVTTGTAATQTTTIQSVGSLE